MQLASLILHQYHDDITVQIRLSAFAQSSARHRSDQPMPDTGGR